jgi:signal peptidase I
MYETEQKQNEVLNNINPGKENKVISFLSFFWDLVKTFIVVMMIAFSIRYFIIQPFVVDGDSMLPNFVNNEYLIAEKISYDFRDPSRGDVVIFRYPKNPEVIYIKRVIGLPGESIEIKNGKVFVTSPGNQQFELAENYLSKSTKTNSYNEGQSSDEFKLQIKDKEFFVLGDNRDHSSDSREWGVLPKGNIIGRVWITVTPLDRFKFFSHEAYDLN